MLDVVMDTDERQELRFRFSDDFSIDAVIFDVEESHVCACIAECFCNLFAAFKPAGKTGEIDDGHFLFGRITRLGIQDVAVDRTMGSVELKFVARGSFDHCGRRHCGLLQEEIVFEVWLYSSLVYVLLAPSRNLSLLLVHRRPATCYFWPISKIMEVRGFNTGYHAKVELVREVFTEVKEER